MTVETVSLNRSHGGMQGVYKHGSRETGTNMTFSVYVPPHQGDTKLPVVWYLSGLTCTHANVTEKGEYRKACAELGLIFVAPDTSPRGEGVPGDPAGAYDFGLGAVSRVNSSDRKTVVDFLKAPDFSVAAFKGQRLTLRAWKLQLRQPILLVDGRMVVSVSPQEGFLHQVSELDTLGVDQPETKIGR